MSSLNRTVENRFTLSSINMHVLKINTRYSFGSFYAYSYFRCINTKHNGYNIFVLQLFTERYGYKNEWLFWLNSREHQISSKQRTVQIIWQFVQWVFWKSCFAQINKSLTHWPSIHTISFLVSHFFSIVSAPLESIDVSIDIV